MNTIFNLLLKYKILSVFNLLIVLFCFGCSSDIKINQSAPSNDDRTELQKQYDLNINTKVSAQFQHSSIVKSANIEISTYKNVVTLSGVVDSKVQKMAALKLALAVHGVKTVISEISLSR